MDFSIILPFGLCTIYTLSSYMLQFLFHLLPTYLSIAYRGLNGRRPSLREDLRALPSWEFCCRLNLSMNQLANLQGCIHWRTGNLNDRRHSQARSMHGYRRYIVSWTSIYCAVVRHSLAIPINVHKPWIIKWGQENKTVLIRHNLDRFQALRFCAHDWRL